MKILHGHGMDLALCDDETCGLLHFALVDENNNIFAQCSVDPTEEWLGDFINGLVDMCFTARMRQKLSKVKH